MARAARKSDPKLWSRVKGRIMRGSKGGRAGQWSARKAQMAVQDYKKRGGGYVGGRDASNHLSKWTQEDWGTASGQRSRDTGERYLPRRARRALSKSEYRRSSDKKRRDTAQGRQLSRQPRDVARKTARYRNGSGQTRAELYAQARRLKIRGRSKMTKATLQLAINRRRK